VKAKPLRIAALADCPAALPEVAAWLHGQWMLGWGLSHADVQDELRRRANRDTLPMAWVALAGEQPVGTVSLVEDERPLEPGSVACVAGLYVTPEWRRRGVARALCDRALAELVQMKRPSAGVFTRDREAFYRHLGWTKVVDTVIEGCDGPELVAFMETPLR
jgi:predicted N-acetyltransferase YhbS